MTIRLSQPPPGSLKELTEALDRLSETKVERPNVFALDASALKVQNSQLPHPVYSIGLEDLANNRSVAQAQIVSWRYILPHTGRAAALEVNVHKDQYDFGGLNEGPFATQFKALAENILSDVQLGQQEYQLRALRVPGLHFFAIWLKGEGTDDIVIPLSEGDPSLVPGRRYSIRQVDEQLQPEAKERLQFNDRPRPKPRPRHA